MEYILDDGGSMFVRNTAVTTSKLIWESHVTAMIFLALIQVRTIYHIFDFPKNERLKYK
jgi:hypothetical protein